VQIAGIVLAMIAVIMVSYKKSDESVKITAQWHYLLPLILFIGCGSIDALINYLQRTFTGEQISNEYLLSSAFMFAAIGGAFWFVSLLILKKATWHTKSLITGLILGIPNFFSMFLVMKSLESNFLNASTFFPVNNMSIVVLGTFISIVAFKEKLSKLNALGIFLSVFAIILIALI
jgi:drug/metabolite transporter (DMT)-like permease